MRVLFVGNYRDGTGWANAAINYILSLDSICIDVVPRFVKLNSLDAPIPNRLKELEQKSHQDCDIIIQNLLPSMMNYDGHYKKNIGLFYTETDSFNDIGWTSYLNTMDELWIPTKDMLTSLQNSHVNTPAYVIPLCFDTNKYSQSCPPLEIKELDGNFVFYFVGEYTRRKNLFALLKAFHSEFSNNESVSLVIKTSIPGKNPRQSHSLIEEVCRDIKTRLKLYKSPNDYIQEVIITEYLSDFDLMRLHATCNCIVSPSFGESWSVPTFDAMAIGNVVIANNVGGFKEYITHDETGILVDNTPEMAFGANDTFEELYTANETWYSISVKDLAKKMRTVFENLDLRTRLGRNGIDRAYDFGYQQIGKMMQERVLS
jgi:glycosyltransferase involved in cell wall biosynthesis